MGNGQIVVSLSGDTANIFNVEYGLSSSSGFTILPQDDNELRNIPPGTYDLTVRAFCKLDYVYNVVKTISGIVVEGNYRSTQVAFNATASRKSYAGCNTGIIALDVLDGSGTFTFTITGAPAGVTVPAVVTPTKEGNTYTLPGQNYPEGDYTIEVSDECFTASRSFTLGTVSGFPVFAPENYEGFRPDVDNTMGSCNYIGWVANSNQIGNANPDYQRYYNDGMYEIAAGPAGGPLPANWASWNTTGTIFLNIAPYNASNFFGANSINIYTRLKACENTVRSFTTNIKKPSGELLPPTTQQVDCDNYTRTIYPSIGNEDINYVEYYGDGMLCYPLDLAVKKISANDQIVYSKTGWLYGTNKEDPITLEYDEQYVATFTDRNGTEYSDTIQASGRILGSDPNKDVKSCDNYYIMYNISLYGTPAKPEVCWDWPVRITITDPNNTVIQQTNVSNTNDIQSPALEYNKIYTIKAEFPDGTSQTITRSLESPVPTGYGLRNVFNNACGVNRSTFYIDTGGPSWPAGTTWTITGPPGYEPQSYTALTPKYYEYMPETTIPVGEYTLTVDHGCGDPVIAKCYIHGIYNFEKFGYDSLMTCSGMEIKPKGTMTYQYSSTDTHFRLISGPEGYDQSVIGQGGSFTFSAAGTYKLGILTSTGATDCTIADTTIVYTAPPLALDADSTSAYVCVGETTGNISVKAINGVSPYTYELYDETNTIKENIEDIVTGGIAHFEYGLPDITYTVRISDTCGNNFSQRVTLANLATAHILVNTESEICNNDTIKLRCLTLGRTQYNWTGPNNFTSPEQNPNIVNAKEHMTGWYKVTVLPEYCGFPVEDSVYIHVYPPLTPGLATANEQSPACVGSVVSMSSSEAEGGRGAYSYQWQAGTDSISGWTDLTDATDKTYSPVIRDAGTFYYRMVTTDACQSVYSNIIAIEQKPCYVPVNPDLRSKP